MYYISWKPHPIEYDVAIHIRRGDVYVSTNNTRLIDLKYYRNIIYPIILKNGKNIKIIIFSEGDGIGFKELINKENNITLYLNTNLLEAFSFNDTGPNICNGILFIILLSKQYYLPIAIYYTRINTWSEQYIPKLDRWDLL